MTFKYQNSTMQSFIMQEFETPNGILKEAKINKMRHCLRLENYKQN